MFLERLWPRLWAVLAVIATFVIASFAGLWTMSPGMLHQGLLAVFGIAFLVAIGFAIRVTSATRDEAVRRIERDSGVPHRPATSYEDTFSSEASDPETQALWQAHRARLAKMLRLVARGRSAPRHASPRSRGRCARCSFWASSFSPHSLAERAADRLARRVRRPLRNAAVSRPRRCLGHAATLHSQAAGDAGRRWPLGRLRFDGVTEDRRNQRAGEAVLITRATGVDARRCRIEIQSEGGEPELIRAEAAVTPGAKLSEVVELRRTLETSARMRLLIGGQEAATWTFVVDPDSAARRSPCPNQQRSRAAARSSSPTRSRTTTASSPRAPSRRAPAEDEDPRRPGPD